jgi:hypothetical protein
MERLGQAMIRSSINAHLTEASATARNTRQQEVNERRPSVEQGEQIEKADEQEGRARNVIR